MTRPAFSVLLLALASAAFADSPPADAKAPAPKPAAAPKAPATADDELVVLDTTAGQVVIDLDETHAPGHAENFKKLVRQGYYESSPFHRVIEGFMAQGGGQWGQGGRIEDVGYTIPAEIVPGVNHHRGSVAAARTGDQVNPERRSSGSQFYICFGDTPSLDGAYTVFGQVVSGMENVDKIVRGTLPNGGVEPAQATKILHASLKPRTPEKAPAKPKASAPSGK